MAGTPPGARVITKDTTVCISLSARPSNIGVRFHNFLYDELGLDFLYKSFATTDLGAAVGGIRALGIRGCGISMPFKEAVIELVDELDASAGSIGSVNTIVNDDGRLVAYNTDYLAVGALLADRGVDPRSSVAVLGSGGMAKAVAAALSGAGFRNGVVVARNPDTGRMVADAYGFDWQPVLGSEHPEVLINATPVGMAGGPLADALPVDTGVVEAVDVVFEVVFVPEVTPLVALAEGLGKTVVRGTEVLSLQAAEQFTLYTGIRPTPDQVARAAVYSRA